VTAGAVLREARRRAGLTQRELAARAGITQSVVSAYESGSRKPSLATLSALVRATGISLEMHLGQGPIGGVPIRTGRWTAGSAGAERPSLRSRPGKA
jgi:transcriptional regulator with XRE-family HTH domain